MLAEEVKKPLAVAIAGAGGGGKSGSGSSHTATEASDTVQSRAMVAVLDLLGEGQIGGLVNGAQSVFLNDTVLMNADGSYNFKGVSWDFRDGSQAQGVVEGFPDVETPYNVSVQVKNASPYTFTVASENTDQVRVIVTIPSLTSTDPNSGDINGSKVEFQFSISNNGGEFVPVVVDGMGGTTITIQAKSRSRYQCQYLLTLPKPGSNYRIRMTRISANAPDSYTSNDTYLDSYYEIVNSKLTYPNSVLFGIRIDSEQFNSIPSRAYVVDGLFIRVPSNYDPETRNYTGMWDGTFKLAVSNNPAWVLYDILLNARYGLGQFINASQVSKAKLYEIGRYCDQLVPDGFGGQEPRFALNTVIASKADAYKVISDIASAFRGMAYWNGGQVMFTQDSPTDPSMLYTCANVVDGTFNYSGSARKDRHSVVHVTWNDPEDNYKQKIEYVEDPELVQSMGIRKAETLAFGCTSRGMAHRVGKWLLYTERVETELISFTVGVDSAFVIPGEVVKIQDQWKAGKRNSGRLKSCTLFKATIDKAVTLSAAGSSSVSIMMPDGTFVDRVVQESGETNVLTFDKPLDTLPLPNALWMVTEPDLTPMLARVVGVNQGDKPGQFVISAVMHNPSKYAAIENGLSLDIPKNTILDPTFSDPESMVIDETTYLASAGTLGTKLHVSWQGKSPKYEVSWRRVDSSGASNWTIQTILVAQFDLEGVSDGATYDFSVVGISATGRRTTALVGTYTVLGTTNPPGPPTNLTAVGDFRAIMLAWSNPSAIDLAYVEVWENSVNDLTTASRIANVTGTQFTRAGLPGLTTRFYWIKAVNKRGLKSQFNSNVGTSATTVQATHDDVVKQFVDESLLAPTLLSGINSFDEAMTALSAYADAVAALQSTVNKYSDRIAALETFRSEVDGPNGQYVTKEDLATAKNETQQAVVDSLTATMTGPTGAIATAVNTLSTAVNDKLAQMQITAEVLNGLKSQYTVKIDNNGYVAGFGLASDATDGVPTSEFLVLADRFAIAQPNAGDGTLYPFVVTTVNGQSRISMNSAFITEVIAATLKSPDNKFRIDLQNKLISIEV